MDAALTVSDPIMARYFARLAVSSAQSARERATSAVQRAEAADVIREAEAVLR